MIIGIVGTNELVFKQVRNKSKHCAFAILRNVYSTRCYLHDDLVLTKLESIVNSE